MLWILVYMYNAVVMWRAQVLHTRLGQCRLEPVPAWNEPGVYGASARGTRKYGTKVCGTGTRNHWSLVPQAVYREPGFGNLV